jgi:HlyD family secretion protein
MTDIAAVSLPLDHIEPLSDDPDRTIKVGALLAGTFFVGFLGWAAFTPLDAGAYAHGVIAVAGSRQAVQTRDGGVITALNVAEGQPVRAGQILLEVSATELRASERSMTGEMFTLLAERQRLIAEREHRFEIASPVEFTNLPPEDQSLANEAMDLQRLQFQARGASLSTQRSVLANQIQQLNEQSAGAQRQLEANRTQQDLNSQELADVERLRAQGYAPKTRVLALQRSAAGLTGEDGAYRSQIGRFNEAIGQTRLQILQLDRGMMEDIASRLRDIQVRLDDLRPKLAAAREQLDKTSVRAPTSGRVVGLSAFTVGGVISPGQTVMEIVPQDRRLVIQARVSPADADDLKPGQRTQIKFSSIHDRSLPMIDGILTRLSADSFTDEKSGQPYFQAEIAAPVETLDQVRRATGGRVTLQPGLPVEVLVPLQKRSALAYLLDPLLQTVWRTGREH